MRELVELLTERAGRRAQLGQSPFKHAPLDVRGVGGVKPARKIRPSVLQDPIALDGEVVLEAEPEVVSGLGLCRC